MFLSTVREIIVSKPECLKQYLNVLMPLYSSQSNSTDEPIRNIVSESIGKLFFTHPTVLAEYVLKGLESQDLLTVSTYARSFKFSAHNNQYPNDFVLFIDKLISLISS